MVDINSLFGDFDLGQVKTTKEIKPKKVKTNKVELAGDIIIENNQLFAGDGIETNVKATVKKINNVAESETDIDKVLKSKKLSLEERLEIINNNVLKVLGKQKNNVLVIRDINTFYNYISKAIKNGRIAIDTETNNSTDAVNCKLMGLCLYTPGEKQAYIPVNHINNKTNELLENQLTEADCREQLQRIKDSKILTIYHNGKFDYEVLKCTCNIEMPIGWDTLVAARQIDENEFKDAAVGLKSIYTKYIDKTQEKYSIDHLFENIAYSRVDPNIFALYASTDSFMTDKIYLWEREIFFDKPENARAKCLFETIEMPIVQITAEIELYGVFIDQELGKRLKLKYDNQLNSLDQKLLTTLATMKPIISAWRLTPEANEKVKQYVAEKTKMTDEKIEKMYPLVDSDGKRYKIGKAKTEQLPEEINIASSTQLAILLFDILGCKNNGTRATGEEEITELLDSLKQNKNLDDKLKYAYEICDTILIRRGLVKLITTYIDVIPELAKHWKDGRVRYRLNSTGTDTGRFASGGKFRFLDENENPVILNSINSQNIPSHNPEVRLLFKATPGYRIVGSDYSGQELRLAAYISQDKKLLDAYEHDQDAYAIIASEISGFSYEDCLEFYPEGTEIEIDGQKVICGKKTHLNPEGKERRSTGKTMVLAGNYGMSGAGAGSLMGKSAKEGQELLDKYFSMFSGLKSAIDESKEALKKNGYVEDILGRRRRLPDIYLQPYEVFYKDTNKNSMFNPFINCGNRQVKDNKLDYYLTAANNCHNNKAYKELAAIALKNDGIIIQANTGRIAQAERQCFNARIQGSAGTLTKKAMIDIFNDEVLRSCDTHLILTVHDEVLVECKEEYADIVEKRLPEVMINAAVSLGIISPKMKCDPYNVSRWYADSAAAAIMKEFKKFETKGLARDEALAKVIKNHEEVPEAAIIKTIETGCDLEFC